MIELYVSVAGHRQRGAKPPFERRNKLKIPAFGRAVSSK
jgi:hypothetical protein